MKVSPALWESVIQSAGTGGNPDELLRTARTLSAGTGDLAGGFAELVRAASLGPLLRAEPDDGIGTAELSSFYSIALAAFPHPEAVELVIDRSSPGALRGLEAGFPQVHAGIIQHIEDFGWIPLRGGAEPWGPKPIVQRLQKVFLRWKPDDIESVAGSGGTAELRGIDLLLKAEHLAGPFLEQVAKSLGRSKPELVLFTHEQITAALEGKEDLQEMMNNISTPLIGQSVSLGRATGRARIIGRAADGGALEFGEVIVTGLSSPDHGGAASIFPTRTDAAVDIHKAAAIVIDDGGLLSHAAMICRESGIPCVVGTERGTSTITDGQYIEVDATKGDGRVRIY